ncbi:hypothetical protein GDO81_004483 [Engystomops pustulosus]|nr:hypothetical protein GDO81_004483 [Engystomops pustulosus]
MAVFVDLNIAYCKDHKRLKNVIEMAAHLGYSVVAINHTVECEKKKVEIRKPISITDLFPSPPTVQGKSTPIKILTRLTLVVSDPCHYNALRSPFIVNGQYNIVAVYPRTEKLFQAACTNIDADLICINVTEKYPFFFRRPPINAAIERGIFFELIYTPAIRDSTMRRYTISNSIALMEVCKGKNIIVSSGAEAPLDLRGPYDVATLGLLFGLSETSAKDAVSTRSRAVILHGEARKTAFGITYTERNPSAKDDEEEAAEPAFKKAKRK